MTYDITSGQVSSGIVMTGDTMNISSGGRVIDTRISDDSFVYVSNGGTAVGTVAGDWGWLIVSNGGVARDTVVSGSRAFLNVVVRGSADGTLLESEGGMYLSNGTATNTLVTSTGLLVVSAGGRAVGTLVSGESASLIVSSRGAAQDTTVENQGTLLISSGGQIAGNLNIASGGIVTVEEEGIVDFDLRTRKAASEPFVNNIALIQGVPQFTITVSAKQADGIYLLANGAANFRGSITISSSADDSATLTVGKTVTLNEKAYKLNIFSGTLLLSAGEIDLTGEEVQTYNVYKPVSSASVMMGKTLVSGGAEDGMEISSGGTAITTSIGSGGWMYVYSGGTATNISAANGAVLRFDVAPGTYVQGTKGGSSFRVASSLLSGYTVDFRGAVYIDSKAVASNVTLAGGDMEVFEGGTALGTEVHDGALAVNGSASETVLHAGGVLTVGGTACSTTVSSGGNVNVSGGTVVSTTISSGGAMTIESAGKVTGTLQIEQGAVVSASSGAVVDFDISDRVAGGKVLVNDLALIQGTPDFTITVSADQAEGNYSLANGVMASDTMITVRLPDDTVLGNIVLGEVLNVDDKSYALTCVDNLLSIAIALADPVPREAADDLNGDGRADVIMTISELGHDADGATGAWLIQEDQTPVWGNLSQRDSDWTIFGTGHTASEKRSADVYVKSTDNVIGAWTTNESGNVTGWETIGQFDEDTQVLGLGDFDGNGQTDLLLRNVNGAVGCFAAGEENGGWNYFESLGDEWEIVATGDLNGDGRDDVVLKHEAGFAGSWLAQENYQMTWANLDTLESGYSIVGTGDFNGDGTDDVLLKKGNYYGAWLVQNGNVKEWMGLGDLGKVTVEQIADFDGDGIDDLRIRTSAGDLGALLVHGDSNLEWKYYGSVGDEWSTSLAAI